jgi:hypothetical protein
MDLMISLLTSELKELRSHIKFIDNLNIDILSTSENYEYSKSSAKRKFEYCSAIISLYGLIENYIEKFCFEYSEILENKIPSYEFLDSKFANNHFDLTIDLIKKVSEKKYSKYASIKKENLVSNLNNCLTFQQPYKLNREAFTINIGNLKHSKICDTIGNLNIKLNEKLKEVYLINTQTENAFNKIDDLVQRRNEIAHGNVQDILDTTEIVLYIDFVEKYLFSIGKIMKNEIQQLDLLYKKINKCILLNDTKVFNGNIIGIPNGKDLNFEIGDKMIIQKSNNIMTSSDIINIKNFENNIVTIKINHNIRPTYKFYK